MTRARRRWLAVYEDRWGALVLWGLALAGVFAFLELHAVGRTFDRGLVTLLGVAYVLCLTIQVAATERWSLRALGLLATITGDLALYGGLAVIAWTGGPRPLPVPVLNMGRAALAVGAVLLLLGLVRWAYQVARGRAPVDGDPEEGMDRA